MRLIQFERVGVKLVIEQSPLAAHQVGVEVVGLEAIQNRSRLAHPAVSELKNGHAGRRVFVFLEVLVLGLGRIARDLGHFSPHHPDEHVKSVTTGRKQTAPSHAFLHVPTILSVPWTDPMVIVDLAIMKIAEQAFVENRLSDEKLIAVTQLETHASAYFCLLGRLLHGVYLTGIEGEWFLDDQVFARLRGLDDLRGVFVGVTRYVDASISSSANMSSSLR